MADTTSTGNTTPTVDQAAPTDTTSAQSTGETVQLAAAAAAVEVSAPARGAEASLTVEPGQTVELKDQVVRFTQDGANLVIHWANTAHTTLVDALAAGTALVLADGTALSSDQVIAQIEGFDPGAIEVAAAAVAPAVAPAAGPAGPATAGGAFNTEFDNGDIGNGLGISGLLAGTSLQFNLLGFFEELAGVIPVVAEGEEAVIDLCNGAQLKGLFITSWLGTRGGDPGINFDIEGETSSNKIGTSDNDTIVGDDRNNTISGKEGHDDISGGAGNDLLIGGLRHTSDRHSLDLTDADNDSLVGGLGDDTLVGDFAQVNASTICLDISVTNDSQSGEVFDGFNDLLVGDGEGGVGGDDLLVGDVLIDVQSSEYVSADIDIFNDNGDNNSYNVFNDFLDGGDGNDTLVGDVFLKEIGSSTSASLFLEVSNRDGNDNVFDAFEDVLWGGNGGGVLVGDAFLSVNSSLNNSSSLTVELEVKNNNGDRNEFNVFNDLLIGGDGADTIVGDVYLIEGTSQTDTTNEVSLTVSNSNGGDHNVFNAFNDHLCGFDGNDLLVGDVFIEPAETEAENNVSVDMSVRNRGTDSDNNTFNAFNDTLLGQGGDDTLVGDLYVNFDSAGAHMDFFNVSLTVSNREGDDNEFFAFNDSLDAGDGDGSGQTLVGDVFIEGTSIENVDINLTVSNSLGGEKNTFDAFNDTVTSGGDGDDILVGDVLVDEEPKFSPPPEVDFELFVVNDGVGSDGNTFLAFNDSLTTGDGSDTLVGDIFVKDGLGTGNYIDLHVSNDDGKNNVFEAFNDTLTAGGGDNVLVGDVFVGPGNQEGSMDLRVVNLGGGSLGNFNDFHAFNDDMTALGGNDTLVGDAWVDRPNSDASNGIDLIVSNSNGDNNAFHAFNDTLNGGGGDNILVGDVWYVKFRNNDGTEESHELTVSNDAGNHNVFSAFNDSLTTGSDNDTMIGDVWFDINATSSHISLNLEVSNFRGDFNTFDAFNDTLTTGGGDNIMVGDVYFLAGPKAGNASETTSEIHLTVTNRSGGDNNMFRAFNDTLTAGAGMDLLVGDVYLELVQDQAELVSTFETTLEVKNDGSFENDFSAFNDTLSGGGGDDVLVGDVFSGTADCATFCADPYDVDLLVSNNTGDFNTFHVFNDSLDGGADNDVLVGDVAFDNPDVTSQENLDLDVFNKESGGDADNNVFDAFNDTLTGGDGDGNDTLVGDVGFLGGDNMPIDIDVSNVGGDNNTFDLFNDDISGGGGSDLLVGDVGLLNNSSPINIAISDSGGTGNVFKLFSDSIDGDGGNDVIFGDFASGDLATTVISDFTPSSLSVSITAGIVDDTLFSDTIDGGIGNDFIWGQLGDDSLTGGADADIFFYTNVDNSSNLGDGNDIIADFLTGADTLNLDALFDALNADVAGDHNGDYEAGGTERTDAMNFNLVGGNLVLTINDTEAAGDFADFSITFEGLTLADELAVRAATVTE